MEIKQIKSTLLKSGIKKGDTLLIHGDAGVTQQINSKKKDKINLFFDILIDYLGKQGNILIPTFTYSVCKTKKFDIKNSNSETGLFSEKFRKRKFVKRTNHPIFSFAIFGKKFKYFNKANITTCFGKDSIFDFFLRNKGKIICLGCNLDRVTFTHHAEEIHKVNYRYLKKFKIFLKARKKIINTNYYVRKLTKKSRIDLRNLHKYLKQKKRIKEIDFGRYKLMSIKSESYFKSCIEMLKKNKVSLIQR